MATIPITGPIVPFLGLIPGGLQLGRMIKVVGRMNHYADRFTIDLQCGAALKPSDNKALHISVRPNENTVVRNHFMDGCWGNEERYGGCAIRQDQHFEIAILAEITFYKITINGTFFCRFNHRIPLNQNANFIYISGDCTILFIGQESDASHASAYHLPPIVPIHTPYAQDPPPPYTPSLTTSCTPANSNVNIHHHYTGDTPAHQDSSGYNSNISENNKTPKKGAAAIGGAIGSGIGTGIGVGINVVGLGVGAVGSGIGALTKKIRLGDIGKKKCK